MKHEKPIKVLYIAGWGRSGSTILSNILGQIDGYCSVGEIRYLWDRSLIADRQCGCGRPFSRCPLWREVLEEAFGGPTGIDPQEIMALRQKGVRTRHAPLMLLPGNRARLRRRLDKYLAALTKLYRAIQTVTGGDVIVDSSKFPTYAYALGLIDEIDLSIVHLVRDPRAAAFSWRRKRLVPDTGDPLPQLNPVFSSLLWDAWNVAAELFWRGMPERYLRLRYEDFAREPQAALRRILALVGDDEAALPFVSDRIVALSPTHTVSGNPNRFTTGQVPIKADQEWRDQISLKDRAVTGLLSWPLLIHYGYL
jgi:hypothetical protein